MVNRVVTQQGFTDCFDNEEVRTLVQLGLVVLDSSRQVRDAHDKVVVINTYKGVNDARQGR